MSLVVKPGSRERLLSAIDLTHAYGMGVDAILKVADVAKCSL